MSKRRKLDQYFTPEFATKTLLEHAAGGPTTRREDYKGRLYTRHGARRFDIHGTILEPCVGDGAISEVFVARNRVLATRMEWDFEYPYTLPASCLDTILTNDLDPAMPADTHEDASLASFWEGKRVDWVISNPPFSCAAPIVQLAYAHADKGIAMLLRLSFLEPCKGRAEWLQEHPPTQLLVLPRISFTGDGKTDNVTCAWMIWDKTGRIEPGVHVVTKYTAGLKTR